MTFNYDSNGLFFVIYNGATYYYVQNAQGDVIAITNASGTRVVEYTYDAWGNVLSTTGTMANSLGYTQPFRYRGYVYDSELGLYYLQSRYYDPALGRFICADGFVSTGQGLLGHNMFVYCLNNPIKYVDDDGYVATWKQGNDGNGITFYSDAGTGTPIKQNNQPGSLPYNGEPGSSQELYKPDGSVKQKRWYGPDGTPERDRDYDHPGNGEFPHDHEWQKGKRGKEHLPPSPDYEFSFDPVIGIGLIVVCTFGMIVVAADDLTGIGIADDPLYIPLCEGISKGLIMVFG